VLTKVSLFLLESHVIFFYTYRVCFDVLTLPLCALASIDVGDEEDNVEGSFGMRDS
jgi:hypothetical protein